MMGWVATHRADIAGGKQVQVASGMAYIKPNGKGETP